MRASPPARVVSKELDKLEQLFHGVLDLASEEERAEYLARACGSDAGLRQRVEKLLQAHQTAGGFLSPDTPPVHGGLPMSELDLPPSEKPGDQIGRYTLLERIGEGGSCVVYRAGQDEPVRRQVALKLIKAGMDTRQVVARFEIERQTLALMDHPHIARVFDAGVTPAGRPYFVMELVHGIPITRFCEQQRLTLRQRLELFTQVCQAVQHAHQKGIIHRDLKPSNILVTNVESVSAPRVTQPARDDENSGRPRAKPAPSTTREQPAPRIIDFGIAKAVQSSITGPAAVTWAGQFVGTPAYMSPEQAAMNGDIDVRSDIYSLGALLYELLTGVTAFDQESLSRASFDEIRRTILETEPPKPSTRLKELSSTPQSPVRNPQWKELRGDLDWIVMKAMDKDRGRRYETANDFAGDVQRFLAHEPVQAGPPTATYRARKFVRRHRVGVVMAAAVTMALLAGLALALMGLRRARQAESVAHLERDRAVHAEEMMRQERDRAIQAETDRRGILSLFDERLGANEDEMAPYYDAARLARERLQPTNPATMNFILPLGRNLGRRGAWSDTLEVYLWLSKAASWNCDFQTHAHAAALAGGRSEVRAQLLFEIVARFGDTWDTITAMQVARAVLIDPDFQKHRKTGVDCAAKAFREAPEYAWSRIVQGMGEYRCGRWPEAIKVLEKAERDPDPRLAALAGSFGAMARYQAGQTNAARESLDRASQLLNRLQQTGVLPGNEWHFVVFGLVARAEAERLILGREVSPPVTVESLAEVRRQWKVVRENLVMGEALAVQGNWNASRDAYVRALDNPSFDWDAAEDESPVRCLSLQMSTVFARVGDKASHERLCRLFLRMNPGGQGSLIAERRTTPWAERYTRACFIFAQGLPSELRQPALELARFAVANQATHQDNHAGWTALAGGMAEYHAGPPERAMELLRVTESDDSAVLRSLAMAYHAMALHKLNRPTEALRLLKEAEDLISKNPQNLHSTQCWWDAEQCRLALEEARRLIQPGTK
jgi:serine/threonine protein kinase/tetratricopeptide (TPR) repeat protein